MARSRNIKPAFFTNEVLGTLDPIINLTFVGLWCLADKEGILEDRPLRIKGELFPYREGLDINGYLTVLARLGFIERYEVDGTGYIHILNFEKHQSPHHTEKAKGFPKSINKNNKMQDLTVKEPLQDSEIPVPTRSDSLIPDSLIPDSLIDDTKQERKSGAKRSHQLPSDFSPTDDHQRLANDLGVNLPHEFTQFADYHKAKGSTMKDWDAALRTWLRNAAKFAKPPPKKSGYTHDTKNMNYSEGVDEHGNF